MESSNTGVIKVTDKNPLVLSSVCPGSLPEQVVYVIVRRSQDPTKTEHNNRF